MRELMGVAAFLIVAFVNYMLGVYSMVDLLRTYDGDLYCEWMHRRKERRRRK